MKKSRKKMVEKKKRLRDFQHVRFFSTALFLACVEHANWVAQCGETKSLEAQWGASLSTRPTLAEQGTTYYAFNCMRPNRQRIWSRTAEWDVFKKYAPVCGLPWWWRKPFGGSSASSFPPPALVEAWAPRRLPGASSLLSPLNRIAFYFRGCKLRTGSTTKHCNR